MLERVNPEVLLKAAEVARPGINWVISDGIVMDDDSPPFYADYFNPLTSDADAWALCEVLERRGIIFKCIWTPSRDYYCWHYQDGDIGHGGYETKQEAMLQAVARKHSLPLYVPR